MTSNYLCPCFGSMSERVARILPLSVLLEFNKQFETCLKLFVHTHSLFSLVTRRNIKAPQLLSDIMLLTNISYTFFTNNIRKLSYWKWFMQESNFFFKFYLCIKMNEFVMGVILKKILDWVGERHSWLDGSITCSQKVLYVMISPKLTCWIIYWTNLYVKWVWVSTERAV